MKEKRPIRIEGDVAYIPLTHGYEAIIDAADVALVEPYSWSAQIVGETWVYARSQIDGKTVRLNSLLAPGSVHFDYDSLNNRRSNLVPKDTPRPRDIKPIRIEGDVAYIELGKGYEAIIDAADVPLVEGQAWSAQEFKTARKVYVRAAIRGKTILLHRFLTNTLDAGRDVKVDHRNDDGLDNRRANLRVCTNAENVRNRRNMQRKDEMSSIYKGVSVYGGTITARCQNRYLGSFPTEIDAAMAHDVAARKLFGEFAKTNEDLGLLPTWVTQEELDQRDYAAFRQ